MSAPDFVGWLREKPVPLHPDLRAAKQSDPVLGTVLRHPLVLLPFFHDLLAKFANDALAHRSAVVEKANAEGDFERAVFMHERPWRLEAFLARRHLMDSEKAGRLMGMVWRDSENPYVNLCIWKQLWMDRRTAVAAMDAKEQAAFGKLLSKAQDGKLVLFRGLGPDSPKQAARGLSWTTCPDTAHWFAVQSGGGWESIIEARPDPGRLLAFMNGRKEQEVILNARGLRKLGLRGTVNKL